MLYKYIPVESECEKQKQLIRELEQERSQCGIFKGRKKKEITERLNVTERPRLEELEKNVADQRAARDKRIAAEIAELLKEVEPQRQEQDRLKKREKEILNELTRPRRREICKNRKRAA